VKRLLVLPLAGTIAALVMIAYARQERQPGEEETPPELPPFDFPDVPEHGDDEEEPEPGRTEPREFQLQLEADGSILDLEAGLRFASIDELREMIGGDARHTLFLANGKGVTREALDAAEARLRDRYQVRKVYRAPDAPPGEDR
jgi:hypothetical protein